MKQTLLMIVLTFFGTFGVLSTPFLGVAIYYLFAVLRPQHMWYWVLPPGVSWSLYVAVPTLAAAVLTFFSSHASPARSEDDRGPKHFSATHAWLVCFAVWVALSTLMAFNVKQASTWFVEYLKIFVMIFASAVLISNLKQIWTLYLIATISLCYIAYEVNFLYLVNNYLGIYHNGYGGLDNNGAGLTLAMGVPLCIFGWEATQKAWRWFYLAMVPVLLHAVLMTYSRGAMVSLLAVVPLLFLRSRHKRLFSVIALALALALPLMAGREIRARFFTVQTYQTDGSAQSRFGSWRAAWEMVKDYPILGVGVRNSALLSLKYGADMENRTIHSQYLQIAADSGFPGLVFYLATVAATWHALRRTRRATKTRQTPAERQAYGIASGVECSLAVFLVGGLFLSLEVFELPYLLLLLGAQLPLVLRLAPQSKQERVASPVTTMLPSPRRVGLASTSSTVMRSAAFEIDRRM